MRMMRKAVLYEDKDIIALNKPSGIPVQGGTKSQEKNIDRLLSVLRKSVRKRALGAETRQIQMTQRQTQTQTRHRHRHDTCTDTDTDTDRH